RVFQRFSEIAGLISLCQQAGRHSNKGVLMSIAFIGLGSMGHHMAANLLESGRPVHVWNRSQEPVRALAALGAKPAATPAECGIADVVFTMLADDNATRAVLLRSEERR